MAQTNNEAVQTAASGGNAWAVVMPLALAQFIASFAATNMNVAISSIAHDLNTTILGVQTAITLFTLVMAALMIPGSKLTDMTRVNSVIAVCTPATLVPRSLAIAL